MQPGNAAAPVMGANRCINSLLEALVYGKRIAEDVVQSIDQVTYREGLPEWNDKGTTELKKKWS